MEGHLKMYQKNCAQVVDLKTAIADCGGTNPAQRLLVTWVVHRLLDAFILKTQDHYQQGREQDYKASPMTINFMVQEEIGIYR